jgi:hypothetical protein
MFLLARQCIGKTFMKAGGTLYKVPAVHLTIGLPQSEYLAMLERERARSRLYFTRQRVGLKALAAGRRTTASRRRVPACSPDPLLTVLTRRESPGDQVAVAFDPAVDVGSCPPRPDLRVARWRWHSARLPDVDSTTLDLAGRGGSRGLQ